MAAMMGTAEAQILTQIGVTELRSRYGASLPEGAGIVGWLTGAEEEQTINSTVYGIFWADLNAASLNSGRTINLFAPVFPPSPASYSSVHATAVASAWYAGPSGGVSPDLSSIVQMSANSFVDFGALQTGSGTAPEIAVGLPTPSVVNASWAGTSGVTAVDTDVLRRIDYLMIS